MSWMGANKLITPTVYFLKKKDHNEEESMNISHITGSSVWIPDMVHKKKLHWLMAIRKSYRYLLGFIELRISLLERSWHMYKSQAATYINCIDQNVADLAKKYIPIRSLYNKTARCVKTFQTVT